MNSLAEVKNRILSRTPLEQVIAEGTTVQKRAGRLVACCPFHAEKTPSFYIYDDHYHCFGCGAHGDAISYVQHQQGLSFMEALRWLARKYAIDAPELEQASGSIKQWQKAARQAQTLLAAQEFFTAHLAAPHGEAARTYLQGRGFSEKAITDFGFGYAPDEPQALMQHLTAQGYKAEELEANSLVTVYQNKAYDFFRHRLTIPIRDTHGRLIAFGGRAMGNQQQKYKNSRYDKGSVLFGLDTARKAMRQKSRGIVVEGYLDTLQLHQHGLGEAVACQGTALTREHMRSLRAATSMVYLLFDGDQAGENASLKALKESLNFPELEFKVALLPRGEDPDSYVRKHGSAGLEAILQEADDLLSFGIQTKLASAHQAAIPSLITQEFVPWLAGIEDLIKRSFLCQKIAELSGIPSQTIAHAVALHERPAPLTSVDELEAEAEIAAAAGEEPVFDSLRDPGPLAPLHYEMLGHLFYASPGDIDVAAFLTFMEHELSLETTWHFFMGELLNCLTAGRSPHQQDASYWVAGQSMAVMQLMARMRENAPAFAGQIRKNSLTRLQLITRQNNIRNTVTSLKDQLTRAATGGLAGATTPPGTIPAANAAANGTGVNDDKEEWRRTLAEITKLSQRLYQIEREIRQI